MVRAFETFRDKKAWSVIQKNGMSEDFSWDSVALRYEDIYMKALYFKQEGYLHGADISDELNNL